MLFLILEDSDICVYAELEGKKQTIFAYLHEHFMNTFI